MNLQIHSELSDSDSSEEDEEFDFEYDENPEIYEDDECFDETTECFDEEDWFVSSFIFCNVWAWIKFMTFLFKKHRTFCHFTFQFWALKQVYSHRSKIYICSFNLNAEHFFADLFISRAFSGFKLKKNQSKKL